MTDPLTQVVGQLRLGAGPSKLVTGSGRWAVRRSDAGEPFYCVVLDGACRLAVAGREPVTLATGDFVLIPAAYAFTVSSLDPPPGRYTAQPIEVRSGVFRLGDGPPDVRMLLGHCTFGSPDAALLVSLLPGLVHVRGDPRLVTLVELVNGEAQGDRPGREVVLARLLEVLLIEALRQAGGPAASPGLLRGLADGRVAVALRRMHAEPTRPWTVPELAAGAAMSRSTFFERFRREVGVSPIEYLLGWRMALAKELLRRGGTSIGEVAGQVGYSSASTFSVAFARHVGTPPAVYANRRGRGHISRAAAASSPELGP